MAQTLIQPAQDILATIPATPVIWETVVGTVDRYHVTGTIRVKAGAVLIIRNTDVVFDDTKQLTVALTANNPSRIVVESGGRLEITSALLAPFDPTRMWDGIVVMGTTTTTNGFARVQNVTVRGARIAFLMGTPTYTAAKQVDASGGGTNGGGRIYMINSTALNCHTGAYISRYNPAGATNANQFDGCTFRATAPLADPAYTTTYQGTAVRLPTQYGVRSFNTGVPSLDRCVFELVDNTAAFGNQVVPPQLRGFGCWASNSGFAVNFSTFRNLYHAISITNEDIAYGSTIDTCMFTGNIGGVYLSGTLSSTVRRNTFEIGRDATYEFPFGLGLYNSSLYFVTENRFSSGPDCPTGGCPKARGLNVTLSDGPSPGSPIQNEIYRNAFRNLSTGLYVQRGNAGLLLQCNSFRGPDRLTVGSFTRADIEVLVGLNVTTANQLDMLRNREGTVITGQGKCVQNDPRQAANNIFSHSGSTNTSAKDILVALTPNMPALLYNYTPTNATPNTLGAFTQPRTVTAPSSGLAGVTPNSCGSISTVAFDYVTDCPRKTRGGGDGRAPALLRALLDTTTNTFERSRLLNELLGYYLTDSATFSLDSVIAALGTYGTAAYADIDAGLRNRAGYPAGPGFRSTTSGTATGTDQPATTAEANTSLYDDVQALLAPYGRERTGLAAALRTNLTLRRSLLALANDTTTWGYVSAQAVLSQYLGYQFDPWYESGDTTHIVLPRSISSPLGVAAGRARVATLYPNPATDAVTVQYTLPGLAASSADSGEVLLTDAFGKPCARLVLTGSAGEQTLSLAGLAPGFYAYRVLAYGRLVQTGKVVKLP